MSDFYTYRNEVAGKKRKRSLMLALLIVLAAACAGVGWFTAQFMKVFTGIFRQKTFNVVELLFGTGGMPSSHTAAVCALTVACGMSCGLDSPVFAVSKVLNRIVRDLFTSSGTEDIDRNLKELIGHTPLQVFVGAVVGAVVPFLMCLIPYYRANLIL